MDDSNSADVEESCRRLLRSTGRHFGVTVQYAGRKEKEEYARRLVHLGIDPQTVKFALAPVVDVAASPGANRNALLMHAVGETFLSCDDDSICRVSDLRCGCQATQTSEFVSSFDHALFLGIAGIPQRCLAQSRDLIAAHEGLLGRRLQDLLLPIRSTSKVNVGAMGPRIFNDLAEARGSVAVTVSGVFGDSGLPHTAPFLMATGEGRARFLRAWEASSELDATRRVLVGVRCPTVSWRGPVATTTVTGFDNRVLLPPFVPCGTGEDTAFGLILAKCLRGAYIGHVPVAVLHAPLGNRRYGSLPVAPRLADVLGLVIQGYLEMPATQQENRLRIVGQHFVDCASAGAHDFEAYLLRGARRSRIAAIECCERLLDVYGGEPACWAVEIEHWIACLAHDLAGRDVGAPKLPGTLDERFETTRQFVLHFGQLLLKWPDIYVAARQLRAEGIRVGRALG